PAATLRTRRPRLAARARRPRCGAHGRRTAGRRHRLPERPAGGQPRRDGRVRGGHGPAPSLGGRRGDHPHGAARARPASRNATPAALHPDARPDPGPDGGVLTVPAARGLAAIRTADQWLRCNHTSTALDLTAEVVSLAW